MRVVIVGATGAHGRRIATELIRSRTSSLALVARDEGSLARLASVLGGPTRGVTYEALDASVDPIGPALEGADVTVSCVDGLHAEIGLAAISAGVPAAIVAEDRAAIERVRELDPDARAAGVAVVAGCGFDPGVTNLLIELAAQRLDRVAEIELTVARSVRDTEGRASLTRLLAPFSDRSLPARLPKLVYLPEPLGWVETFNAPHADPPRIRATFDHRVGLVERVASDVARILAATRTRGLDLLWPHAARSIAGLGAPATAWTGARVDAHGTADRSPASVTYGIVDHLENLVPLMTSLAVRALVERAGAGGVVRVEEVVDLRSAVVTLRDRGVRIARLEPERV